MESATFVSICELTKGVLLYMGKMQINPTITLWNKSNQLMYSKICFSCKKYSFYKFYLFVFIVHFDIINVILLIDCSKNLIKNKTTSWLFESSMHLSDVRWVHG